MAISDKARKLLWGRAGARCSYFRSSLVMNATEDDDESIVGDECHVCARHKGGARHNSTISNEAIDAYENLILLCKNHHKMIDDQPGAYPADYLFDLKAKHEQWVNNELQPKQSKAEVTITTRVKSASDVVRIVGGCEAYDFQHDELKTDEEGEAVAELFISLRDYMDLASIMEAGDKIRFTFSVKEQINILDRLGLAIFVGTYQKRWGTLDNSLEFSVAVLRICHMTNPEIQVASINYE